MGLWERISRLVRQFRDRGRRHQETDDFRRCRFETMESRRMLSAEPLRLGAVYVEDDTGADIHGDTFEITFVGGAADTQLSRLVINGDQAAPGLGEDDVMFDTQSSGMGADNASPFQIVSLLSQNPQASVTASVNDGTTSMTLDFSGFKAGDKLVFTIDVDEVEIYDPSVTDLNEINDGLDPITSGVEFQTTKLTAYFSAPHYHDVNGSSQFLNHYDDDFAGSGLPLPADNADGKRDRSDGAIVQLQQTPLPIAISGTVYLDNNLNLAKGSGEAGLANVPLSLWQKTGSSYTFTGHNTVTDSNGNYEFGTGLNLLPGTYEVRETQPDGLFSVGAVPGTVDGATSGATVSNNRDVLTEIHVPLGGQLSIHNDFAEAQPARVSGYVYHDRSNEGARGTNEEGLAGVTVEVIPVDTISPQTTVSLKTDANGFYEATGLAPGTYRIVETTQPAGFFDGLDTPGTVDGKPVGSATNPGESLSGIVLAGGQSGVNYNFGEISPSSIAGRVHLDKNGNCVLDPDEQALSGVTIQLLDANGNILATTLTDENGLYKFDKLLPGVYGIRELQPAGAFHGDQRAGSHGGVDSAPDLITSITIGAGQNLVDYNFCELPPSSIAGQVKTDLDGDCVLDPGEVTLSGVTIQLLDANGNVLDTTKTDADGRYKFSNLAPGTYGVREMQPAGLFHGDQNAGSHGGNDSQRDLITDIAIGPGQDLVEYDFCEIPPSSIAGQVKTDIDGDCVLDPGEVTLSGVTIELLDANGNVLETTKTDADGRYKFSDLAPGTYAVRELQPAGLFNGDQNAGSHGGNDSQQNLITDISVSPGQDLVEYDFCEIPPSSLAGQVKLDLDGDCVLDPGELTLSGVTIELLDPNGNVLATTKTDSEGRYKFDHLAPGTYTVRELQPTEFFQGDQNAGTNGGIDSQENLISNVVIAGGQNLVNYDFCEEPAANLSGYVFQDGATLFTTDGQAPSNLGELRDGVLTSDDTRLAGVLLELRDGFTGEPIDGSEALPGRYPSGPIQVRTDASGYYEFRDIPGGRAYAVFQVHPDGYVDSIDTVGSTTGFAFNPQIDQGTQAIQPLAGQPASDAIIRIAVAPGQSSQNNNFSEVKVETKVIPPVLPPPVFPPPQPPPPIPITPAPVILAAPALPTPAVLVWSIPPAKIIETPAGASIGYSWHLSVINGGMPRDAESSDDTEGAVWRSATHLDRTQWDPDKLREAQWIIGANPSGNSQTAPRVIAFGIRGAIPVAGDFDGDGQSEMGIYYRGEWFIDLNGNGQWDEQDLWAKLGDELDRPVVGDWDGDGKDDIGIHGPEWFGDQRQITREPGLPDSNNDPHQHLADQPKNQPPNLANATDGQRLLRFNANGPKRADVIDHVFRYGGEADSPVAGDWNGDGIRTIGVFSNGTWRVDSDGDGLVEPHDQPFLFGREGDIPVVGDWDGNGLEEVGLYRQGQWILDTNGNHELDAHDRVFEMGGAGDRPVVGDWNGDGVDEPAVYRESLPPADSQIR